MLWFVVIASLWYNSAGSWFYNKNKAHSCHSERGYLSVLVILFTGRLSVETRYACKPFESDLFPAVWEKDLTLRKPQMDETTGERCWTNGWKWITLMSPIFSSSQRYRFSSVWTNRPQGRRSGVGIEIPRRGWLVVLRTCQRIVGVGWSSLNASQLWGGSYWRCATHPSAQPTRCPDLRSPAKGAMGAREQAASLTIHSAEAGALIIRLIRRDITFNLWLVTISSATHALFNGAKFA